MNEIRPPVVPERLLLSIYGQVRMRLAVTRLPANTKLTRWINQAIVDKLDREHPESVLTMADMPQKPSTIDPYALRERMLKAQGVSADGSKPAPVVESMEEGPYCHYCKNDFRFQFLYEDEFKRCRKAGKSIERVMRELLERDGYGLTGDQQREIMEEHARKQAIEAERISAGTIPEELRGHPRLYAKWRAEQDAKLEQEAKQAQAMEELPPLVNCAPMEKPAAVKVAKLAEDQEDDFWDDETDAAYRKLKAKAGKKI